MKKVLFFTVAFIGIVLMSSCESKSGKRVKGLQNQQNSQTTSSVIVGIPTQVTYDVSLNVWEITVKITSVYVGINRTIYQFKTDSTVAMQVIRNKDIKAVIVEGEKVTVLLDNNKKSYPQHLN